MQMPGYGKSRRDQVHWMPSLARARSRPGPATARLRLAGYAAKYGWVNRIGCNSGYTETMKTASLDYPASFFVWRKLLPPPPRFQQSIVRHGYVGVSEPAARECSHPAPE